MERLTISRLGQVRNKSGISKSTGKPYSFNEVGFQTNEYGERWFNFTFNGQNPPINVGQTYEMEVTERSYFSQKQGSQATAYVASFPKKQAAGGLSEAQWVLLNRKLDDILTQIKILHGKGSSWAPTVADMDFSAVEDPTDVPESVYDDDPDSATHA